MYATAGEPVAAPITMAAYPLEGRTGWVVVGPVGTVSEGQLCVPATANPTHPGSDVTVGTPAWTKVMVAMPKPRGPDWYPANVELAQISVATFVSESVGCSPGPGGSTHSVPSSSRTGLMNRLLTTDVAAGRDGVCAVMRGEVVRSRTALVLVLAQEANSKAPTATKADGSHALRLRFMGRLCGSSSLVQTSRAADWFHASREQPKGRLP